MKAPERAPAADWYDDGIKLAVPVTYTKSSRQTDATHKTKAAVARAFQILSRRAGDGALARPTVAELNEIMTKLHDALEYLDSAP